MAKKAFGKSALIDGNIIFAIILFALPIALGNFFAVAASWGDGYVLSHYVGKEAFSGMGVGGTLISFGAIFATAFPVGMSNLSSRYYIEGDLEKMRRNFVSSLFLSFLAALGVVALTLCLIDPLLPVLNLETSSPLYGYAKSYAYAAVFSFFGTTLYSFLISYLRSIGEKKMPLLLIAIDSGFVLFFDYVFVVLASLGVLGVAISAIIAPLLSDFVGFFYLAFAHPDLRPHWVDWKLQGSEVRKQLRLSLPLSLELVIIAFGSFAIQSAIDGLGEDAIYALSALGKLTSLLGLFSNGLNNAIAPFVAQNLAFGKISRAKRGLIDEVGLCCLCSLVDMAAVFFAYQAVVLFFLGEASPAVMSYARKEMLFTLLIYALSPFYGSFRFALGAIDRPMGNMVAGFLQLVSQLAFVYFFSFFLGEDVIIGATALSEILPVLWVSFEIVYFFFLPPSFAHFSRDFPRR